MIVANTLVPSIERRLATWIELKKKESPEFDVITGPTITISRQFGCEAFPVSEELQQTFAEKDGRKLTIFDRALIERVGGDDQILQSVLGYVGSASLMDDLLAPLIHSWHSHEQAFTRLATDIMTIARGGDAIIIGRGAAILTASLKNCFHFRIQAPLDFRISSIARRTEIPEAEAEAYVKKNEKKREQFIERFLTCDIANPVHYHACFNNARVSIEEIVSCIYVLVTEKMKDD